ncbi:MAG: translation initiation factor IF-2 N-terminal domain-containing protein, partial [Myxococcales bacterium]|nr:translation initiation factor IF-2 N-terminal domain-containing protein [Myxococcales bacterium]
MSSKVRVYEVARELGVENLEIIQRMRSLGIQVRNHMSVLDPVEVDRVKRSLDQERSQTLVEEHIRPTVVRRKRRAAPKGEPEAADEAVTSVVSRPSAMPKPAASPRVEPPAPEPGSGVKQAPSPAAEAPAVAASEPKGAAAANAEPEPARE